MLASPACRTRLLGAEKGTEWGQGGEFLAAIAFARQAATAFCMLPIIHASCSGRIDRLSQLA